MALTSADVLKLYQILLQDLGSVEVTGSNVFNPNHVDNSNVPLSQSKILGTRAKSVIGAINELVLELQAVEDALKLNQDRQFDFLGDYFVNPAIKDEILKVDSSVSEAVIKLAKALYGNDLDNPQTVEETIRSEIGLPAPVLPGDIGRFIRVKADGEYEYGDAVTLSGDPNKILVSDGTGNGILTSSLGISDVVNITDISLQGSQVIHVDANHTGTQPEDGSINRPYKDFTQFAPNLLAAGTIIHVGPGTYTTNIALANNTGIKGAGIGKTVFTGTLTSGTGNGVFEDFSISNTLTLNSDTELRAVEATGAVIIDGDLQATNFSIQPAAGTAVTITNGNVSLKSSTVTTTTDVPTVIQNGGSFFTSDVEIQGSRVGGEVFRSNAGTFNISDSSIVNSLGGSAIYASNSATSNSPNVVSDVFRIGSSDFQGSYTYIGDFFGSGPVSGTSVHYRDSATIEDSSTVGGATVKDSLDSLDSAKANKVSGATAGNFASLNASGDLVDSGNSAGDFSVVTHLHTGVYEPVDATILREADVVDNLTSTSITAPLSANQGKALEDGKTDKVSGATAGNFAGLDASGNLTDSGSTAADFATAAHLHTGVYEPADATILRQADVINSLNSTSTIAPLSAAQGKQLQDSKMPFISAATSGNLASMNALGAATNSGIAASDVILDSFISIRSSKTFFVDGSKSGTYVADGSINKPYKTIQAAIDAAPNFTTLVVSPGTYAENLSISGKSGLALRGEGGAYSGLSVLVQGKLTFDDSEYVNIDSIVFNNSGAGASDYALDLGSTTSQTGNVRFYNCSFNRTANTQVAVRLTGALAASIAFDFCNFVGILVNAATAYVVRISGVSSSDSKINTTNAAASTFVVNCPEIGAMSHTNGILTASNIGIVYKDGSNISITSSAAASATAGIFLTNVSLLQPDGSYGNLFKTGTCNFVFTDVTRDPSQVSFTGTELTKGRLGQDIQANYTPTNYTGTPTDDLVTHLSGIDAVLASNPTTNNPTFTGIVTADQINSSAGNDLTLAASSGQDVFVVENSGEGLSIASGGNATFTQDLTVTGNLAVNGTTTTIDTQNLLVEDTIITLNRNAVAPSQSGIDIKKGAGAADKENLLWHPTDGWIVSTGNETTATRYKIWHENNQGTGSGLDADLLDGQEGSYYLSLANSTGTLPVGKGGTNATSFTANEIVVANGTGTALVSSGNQVSDFALTGHTHVATDVSYSKVGWGGITNVDGALDDLRDNKADLSHTHTVTDINEFSAITDNGSKFVVINAGATAFEYKTFVDGQLIYEITAQNVTDGYFELPNEPINPESVSITRISGALQTNKVADPNTILTSWNFEPDADNKTRIYFDNQDGHTGLDSGYTAGEILIVKWVYLT